MACYGNIVYGPTADDVTPALDTLNNVVLPTTGKPRLSLKPVYASDGVTVAYYSYNLTVDCQIYARTALATDPASDSVENEVTRIRNILSTPGLKLVISPVGLGAFPVVNGTEVPANSTPDVIGGPFPEDVSVSPIITNNMIGISWTIRFGISHCPPTLRKDFVQFNTELDLTVDEEGWFQFSINTHYQTVQPLTNLNSLTPLVNAIGTDFTTAFSFQGMQISQRTSQSRDKRMTHITFTAKEIKSDSPYFPWMKNVEVSDSIKSSLFETDAIKGAGFQTWERTLSGTINVGRRIPKIWAWVAFATILKERFIGMQSLTKIPSITAWTKPANQGVLADSKNDKGGYLLTNIEITNHLYSTKIDFNFSYLITMNLLGLLKGQANFFYNVRSNIKRDATNPLAPVYTLEHKENKDGTANSDWPNNSKSTEWLIWQEFNTRRTNSDLGYISNGPIVFAQCLLSPGVPIVPVTEKITTSSLAINERDPIYNPPAEPAGAAGFGDFGEMDVTNADLENTIDAVAHLFKSRQNLAQKSWVDYKNKITIIEQNNNSQATYLQTNTKVYFQASEAAAVTNQTNAFVLDNKSGDNEAGIVQPETFVHGASTYQIRMTGYAIRVGHKIPIPAIISVGGSPVTRTGECRYEHQTLRTGSTLGEETTNPDEFELPVYHCQWDILYNVDTNLKGTSVSDVLSRIMSSGDPSHYI